MTVCGPLHHLYRTVWAPCLQISNWQPETWVYFWTVISPLTNKSQDCCLTTHSLQQRWFWKKSHPPFLALTLTKLLYHHLLVIMITAFSENCLLPDVSSKSGCSVLNLLEMSGVVFWSSILFKQISNFYIESCLKDLTWSDPVFQLICLFCIFAFVFTWIILLNWIFCYTCVKLLNICLIWSLQGGAEHKIPVVISKISKEQKGMLLFVCYSCHFIPPHSFFFSKVIFCFQLNSPGCFSSAMASFRWNAKIHINTCLHILSFSAKQHILHL